MNGSDHQNAIDWTAEKLAWRALIGAIILDAAMRSGDAPSVIGNVRKMALATIKGAGVHDAGLADATAIRQAAARATEALLDGITVAGAKKS